MCRVSDKTTYNEILAEIICRVSDKVNSTNNLQLDIIRNYVYRVSDEANSTNKLH